MTRGQGGFWHEYTAAVVLAIILGAALAAGIAGLLDVAFGRVLADVLGPTDEYTLIVHVQARSADAATEQIGPLLATLDADGRENPTVRTGVTVAGNANFFVTIPEPSLSSALLEQLPVVLQQVPGFNGYTWLLEPSVTVAALEPGTRDVVAAEAAALDGVRAVVRHGSRVTAVVKGEPERTEVTNALKQWLAERQTAEIRWSEETPMLAVSRVLASLERPLATRNWRVLDRGHAGAAASADAALAALARLPAAWDRLTAAGSATEEALRQLIVWLDGLEPALALAEQPERQAERLAASLRAGDGGEAVKDVLLRVAASMLWQSLAGDLGTKAKAAGSGTLQEPEQPLGAVGPNGSPLDQWRQTRDVLVAAADSVAQVSELSRSDLDAAADALAAAESLLPASAWSGSDGLLLLVEGTVSAAEMEAAVQRGLQEAAIESDPIEVVVAEPGVIEANPRAVLSALLRDVRGAVAGVLALLAAGAALVLDHAVIFAAWPNLARTRGKRNTGWKLASATGAVLFAGTYMLAGGAIPGTSEAAPGFSTGAAGLRTLLEWLSVAGIGAVAGLLTHRLARRISPVNEAELLAGRSLGLDPGQLLREIVVPEGRPGVLTFLNKFRRRFV